MEEGRRIPLQQLHKSLVIEEAIHDIWLSSRPGPASNVPAESNDCPPAGSHGIERLVARSRIDGLRISRLCTSWATSKDELRTLQRAMHKFSLVCEMNRILPLHHFCIASRLPNPI
jgi:hypothetical protein